MKSLMTLWKSLAMEAARVCGTSTTRDIQTVTRRVEHEGLSFLTITLTNFGKDFEKSLDQGFVDRNLFLGFQRKGCLPRLLSGFTGLVFDPGSGVLLHTPSVEAIRVVRQLTLMFGKMHLECSSERTSAAIRGYVQCEKDVRESDARLSARDKADFHRVSRLLFQKVFTEMDRKVYYGEILPKHGPGATADAKHGNAKYRHNTWPARLDQWFPAGDYILPNHRFVDELDPVHDLEPGAEIPVKVITVPKTLKTPRIIGVEPTAMQYAQQGVLTVVLDALERDDFLSRVIGFDDQTPNQRLARQGSLHGDLATLDLSEASDRVSNEHVLLLCKDHPHLSGAVQACRSRKARVPGHGVIRLAKFASMGSALCFPFEAMVFTTLVFLGIERELSTSLDRKTLYRLRDQVRIYGDDILVPVDFVSSVVHTLESFGARVNANKSFWTGKFRESCGKEYYAGEDVSIVRVREMLPTRPSNAAEVISTVSLRNQLYMAGYWQTVRWLDEQLSGILKQFPTVLPSSPVLGRHSFLGFETHRSDKHLHSPLVKGWKVSARPPSDPLDGPAALTKCLLLMERRSARRKQTDLSGINPGRPATLDISPTVGVSHLERYGRPKTVRINLGWHSPV